eukprot:6048318-Lingulodinium_polyedra.AAC.1
MHVLLIARLLQGNDFLTTLLNATPAKRSAFSISAARAQHSGTCGSVARETCGSATPQGPWPMLTAFN